jgi:hypothetical protein
MREYAPAERAGGQGIGLLAVISGIGVAHCFCPFRGLFPDQALRKVDGAQRRVLQPAVRTYSGYLEKV